MSDTPTRAELLVAPLLALTKYNIPGDIQELLTHGDPSRGIPPGALSAAMDAALSHIDKLEAERDQARAVNADLLKRFQRHEAGYSDMLHRAADETSRLRAELERAREVLAGMMRAYEALGGLTMDGSWYSHAKAFLSPNPSAATSYPPRTEEEANEAANEERRELPVTRLAACNPSKMESDAPYLRALVMFSAKLDGERVLQIAENHEALIAAANARRTP